LETTLRLILAALLMSATATLSTTGCALFEDEEEDEVREPFDVNEDDDDEDEDEY
jgi:hypothetical protein